MRAWFPEARCVLASALAAAVLLPAVASAEAPGAPAGAPAGHPAPARAGHGAAPPPRAIHYRFNVDGKLTRLTARVCFDGAPPAHLYPGTSRYLRFLTAARRLPRGPKLPVDRDGLDLDGVPAGACIRYRIDLAAAVAHPPTHQVLRVGTDLLATPDLWLWHPEPAPQDLPITARFRLPRGMHVAVPWPRAGRGYRVPWTTFPWRVDAAFGHFRTRAVKVDGGVLHVTALGHDLEAPEAAVLRWVRHSAEAVSTLYGRLPERRVQLLLAPIPGQEDVLFGATGHGGGPGILAWVGTETTAKALKDDWILPHELIHVGQPHLPAKAAWLFEGLATYYGPLTRARAGLISPERAWSLLVDGFGRGHSEQSTHTLADDSAHMDQRHNYWRVYWGGAAILLQTDVAMRRQGTPGGLDALVKVLWRDEAAHRAEDAGGAEDRLDAAVPGNPLRRIATEALGSTGFPKVAKTLKWLGVEVGPGGEVTLSDTAPGAAVRRAMTAPSGTRTAPRLQAGHPPAKAGMAVPAKRRR